MSRVLICGTLAYDDIGEFDVPWSDRLRNVKLTHLHRGFGGCAMNLAYNLTGLGHVAVPFVYVGDDYPGDYARHVAGHAISEAGVFQIEGIPCARGIVLTGPHGVQFTAFYPGPSGLERWRDDLDLLLERGGFDAVIIAADLPQKMAGCARRTAHLPLRIWSPGQYAEMLSAEDVAPHLACGGWLVASRHEWQALLALQPATEWQAAFEQIVITDGALAVQVLPQGETHPVPAPPRVVDPTGCGDAFTAALVAARLNGAPLAASVQAGIRLAGRCLGHAGAQSHAVDVGVLSGRRTTG
jgi:adenosine kinase